MSMNPCSLTHLPSSRMTVVLGSIWTATSHARANLVSSFEGALGSQLCTKTTTPIARMVLTLMRLVRK